MTIDVAAALAMLQRGDPLDQVLSALTPDHQEPVVDRCFAARLLDEDVFRIVRATVAGGDAVKLTAVAAHPAFEQVADTGACRTRREDRDVHLRRWLEEDRTVPEWLRALNRELASFYGKDGRRDRVEEVFHLALADPAEAIARLRDAYAAADVRYNLLACRDLLDVAEERAPVAGADFLALTNRLQRRLDSRKMWNAAYERSARFVLPRESEGPVAELVAGDLRVLRIFGPPRSGKSAHLDWLIARRCVPEGFACAHIDFKRIDPLIAAEEPWLLLLEIAHQLDVQLPESPLLNLLQEHGAHRERLVRRPGRGTGALGHLARETEARRRRTADDVRARLYDPLAAPGGPQLLIALDSLEAALLADDATATHHGAQALVEELLRLKAAVPHARFVLAGHSDPSGARESITSLLGGKALQPSGLTADEAHRYLVDKWNLAQPEPVIRRAASVYGTTPSELERIGATLAEADGEADGDVGQSQERYVAQRLKKIRPAEARWLLRYAVVARRIDAAFVRDVLAEPLTLALRGDSALDDPARDPGAAALGEVWRDLFPPARDDSLHVDALWTSLRRHLLLVSWADVDADGTVVIDERVAGPLRRLLRGQPVYAQLSRAAARHYEGRAEEDEARWSEWMSASLYHHLEVDPDEAVESWRRSLQRARGLESRHVVRLCVALLEASAAGDPTLDPAVVKEAWLEFAWANIRIAREAPGAPRGHDGWARADEGLEAAERQPTPVPLPGRTALVRAALLRRDGHLGKAAELLAAALDGSLPPEQALRLRVEYASVLGQMGSREAVRQYRRALKLAGEVPHARPDAAAILRRLAFTLADRDRYRDAIGACDEGLSRAAAGSLGHAELCLLRADLAIRSGAPDNAHDLLQPAFEHGGSATHGAALTAARAALAGWDPARAVAILKAAMPPARSPTDAAEYDVRAGEIHEWLGVANSHLLEISGAFEHLESAAKHWAAAGFAGGAARCQARAAELQLRGLDDVHGAALTLERAARAEAPSGGDDARMLRLREAECADRSCRGEEARQMVDAVIAQLTDRGAPPRLLVQAAIEGMALRSAPVEPRLVELLLRSAGEVQGYGARLRLVDGIWRCPTLHGIDEDLLRRLEAVLKLPTTAELVTHSPRDQALLKLRAGEVARMCARPRTASRRIAEGIVLLGPETAGVYVTRRVNAAAGRVAADSETAVGSLLAEPPPEGGAHPILNAATLIERAELELEGPGGTGVPASRPLASTLLQAAEKVLLSRPDGGQGRWLALVNELYATVTEDEAAKTYHRERANELYSRLREGPTGGSAPPARAARLEFEAGPGASISLRQDGERLIVVVVGPDDARDERAFGTENPLVERLLEERPATLPAYERLARDAPATWRRWAAHAAEIVLPESLRRAGTADEPLHVRLYVGADMALAAVPWELALVHARCEGATGLGTLFRATGAPRPPAPPAGSASEALRVLVLRAERDVQRRALRGPGATSSLTVEDVYRHVGPVELAGLATASLPEVESKVRSLRPHVLHVAAPLVTSGGVPTVDLSAHELRSADRERLPATALARLVELAGGPPPLLVLDPPGPPNPRELVLQLLLRNAFAADVLAITGGLPTVATGLGRYAEQDAIYATLAGAFAEARSGQDLVARVRAGAELGHAHAGLAHAAIALFAEVPDVPLPVRAPA